MERLNIVRGDIKNKPVSSGLLAEYFESIADSLEGTLYLGYPIIGTSQGGFQIDALLVSKQKGIFVFDIKEGADNTIKYKDVQDDNYNKLQSKLIQHNDLTSKRKLGFEINTVTYAPAWSNVNDLEQDYPIVTSNEELKQYIEDVGSDIEPIFNSLLSVIQSITSIRKGLSRGYVVKPDSRGFKLKKLEESIANLDRQQSSAVIETVQGVQRIRGLAGSGKTIILALKVAYLHAKNPTWKIGVTFNTRSLKAQFKNFIRLFSYEHTAEEPNWDKIDIIHAWGSSNTDGIYLNICKDHNVEFLDFSKAKKLTTTYGKEFDKVCEKALSEIDDFQSKYDLIVIDEAQDFSKEFLIMCYNILNEPKRLVYAYDELQSLNAKTMLSPESIFGNKENGNPKVTLKNETNRPKQDIILYKCYRNSLEILTSAHALGFGIYRNELVQMFENSVLWKEIGYKSEDGDIAEGVNVTLKRDNDSSPEFLSNHSEIDDLLQFKSFATNEQQVEFVVNDILNNIKNEELLPSDIIVINPNPLRTKNVVGLFRKKLYDLGINSTLAGVSSSPDVFFISDSVTFTGIYRAKGNEAAMVYVINSQYCYDGWELAKKRNILFTAMTRSKAWVRVCGYGIKMNALETEYKKIKNNNFKLIFKYPTAEERKHMNVVNRDMSIYEMKKIEKNNKSIQQVLEDLKSGDIQKEDLPKDLIEEIRKMLD